MTHICVRKLTIIGSNNSLSPSRRQAIIYMRAGILSNGPLGRNLSEIFIEIHTFLFRENAFEDVVRKMAAISERTQCANSPSHYLGQCRFIVIWMPGNTLWWNLNQTTTLFTQKIVLKLPSATWRSFCIGHNVSSSALVCKYMYTSLYA